MAALLPAGLPAMPQPQLRGPPGGRGGGPHPGRGGSAELRAAPPGAVALLDLLLRLRALRHLRSLLERLCLRTTRRQATSYAMKTLRVSLTLGFCFVLFLRVAVTVT